MWAHHQACAFLLGRLRAEVSRLRAIQFPGHDTGPRKWLNFISGLLDTSSAYLEEAKKSGLSASQISELVQEAESLGDQAYYLLTYVAGADSTQIPHQVVAPFQRWVEALGISQTIFFRAEHLPNYELGTIEYKNAKLLKNASPTLLAAHDDITWPALRVSVPGQAMGLLPHFAVVAHELGHAIEDRYKPDFSPFAAELADAVDRAKFRLQAVGIPFTSVEELQAQQIVQFWLNELKADAIAHYLVGPAFFFALCGFLELSGQGYGVSQTHPPSDMRRHFLFQCLQAVPAVAGAKSYAEVLLEKTGLALSEDITSPHIAKCLTPDLMYLELSQSIGEIPAALCTELIPAFYKLVPTVFDSAEKHLQSTCPTQIYSPDQFSTDIDRHLVLLCALVPPIEYREGGAAKACSLSTILNVGWVALLTQVNNFPASRGAQELEGVASRMECLHELLLKAVELSEARQLWENPQ